MNHREKSFHDRAGFTLIHQLLLVATIPVILMAATTWVHESLKMSSAFKHRCETNVALNHFSNQFQNDVHGSKSLDLNSELNQLELTGHEGQQIVFQIDGGQINKTLTVGGEVVARDSFRLSDEYFAEWDAKAGAEGAALKVFRFSTPLNRSAPEKLDVRVPKLELEIAATVNRWDQSVEFGRGTDSGGAE